MMAGEREEGIHAWCWRFGCSKVRNRLQSRRYILPAWKTDRSVSFISIAAWSGYRSHILRQENVFDRRICNQFLPGSHGIGRRHLHHRVVQNRFLVRSLRASLFSRQRCNRKCFRKALMLPLLKSDLRFKVICASSSSSSSSSLSLSGSRIMHSTTSSGSRFGLTPTKGDLVKPWLLLASTESEREEEDGDKSKVFSIGQETDFFLKEGWTAELVAGRPTLGACLRVPSWRFCSLLLSQSCLAFASIVEAFS